MSDTSLLRAPAAPARRPGGRRKASRRGGAERDALAAEWSGLPPYVWGRMRHHPCLRGLDRDDVLQELRVRLLRCAELFDDSRGICFKTYAVRCLVGECLRMAGGDGAVRRPVGRVYRGGPPDEDCRRAAAPPARLGTGAWEEEGAAAHPEAPPANGPERRAAACEALGRCRSVLDRRSWRVLWLRHAERMSVGEIAAAEGVSRQRAACLIDRAAERLREKLPGLADEWGFPAW